MSIQANPGSTIADWTSSKLIRFIKQMFETDPPAFLPRAKIQDLEISGKLTIDDQVSFVRDPNFHNIGSTGEPAFVNGWINYDVSTYNAAGYWKDPFGIVHLRGLISSGTVAATAFTLPVGFRPYRRELFGVSSNNLAGRVDVTSAGQVIPLVGSNLYFQLDGLTFKAL